MKNILLVSTCLVLFANCQNNDKQSNHPNIITNDIGNFWTAYDKIIDTADTIEQEKYLHELYLDKGTLGLAGIIQAKNYTPQDYLHVINNYPKFWASIRENTFKAKKISQELEIGIDKLKAVYPELKPVKIYFTIGALRSSGTTMDSLVLIGSELALTDKNSVTSEFPEQEGKWRRKFFDSNPIDNLVLLNIHEYVHTQQRPIVHNLLSQCLYEGVAEFVSVTAMEKPSSTPAISFGKKNETKVRRKFEEDMFRGDRTSSWLWSSSDNDFNTRDLGYYIGYEICERYYEKAEDKKLAIKEMIELDYRNEAEIEEFVDGSSFFSTSLENLYNNYNESRPIVVNIKPFENGNEEVNPNINQITVDFSKVMDERYRNFNLGPLGENHILSIKKFLGFSEGGKSVTFEVELEPNKHYQLTIGSGFRDENGTPLKPYLIDFKTSEI